MQPVLVCTVESSGSNMVCTGPGCSRSSSLGLWRGAVNSGVVWIALLERLERAETSRNVVDNHSSGKTLEFTKLWTYPVDINIKEIILKRDKFLTGDPLLSMLTMHMK